MPLPYMRAVSDQSVDREYLKAQNVDCPSYYPNTDNQSASGLIRRALNPSLGRLAYTWISI